MKLSDCPVNSNVLPRSVGPLHIILFVCAHKLLKVGDIGFQSQRRLFQQTVARAGGKSWGYLFTQPQPSIPAFLGGKSFGGYRALKHADIE